MPRMAPLSIDAIADRKNTLALYERLLGFVPASALILARKPDIARAVAQLAAAVWDRRGEVSQDLKALLSHAVSAEYGCRYCMAHTAGDALLLGVTEEKFAALRDFRTSPLYSAAERAALVFALAAGRQPNGVSDKLFARLKEHWSEGQIVEIAALVAFFKFMNCWNETMDTPLEPERREVAEKFLISRSRPGPHEAAGSARN